MSKTTDIISLTYNELSELQNEGLIPGQKYKVTTGYKEVYDLYDIGDYDTIIVSENVIDCNRIHVGDSFTWSDGQNDGTYVVTALYDAATMWAYPAGSIGIHVAGSSWTAGVPYGTITFDVNKIVTAYSTSTFKNDDYDKFLIGTNDAFIGDPADENFVSFKSYVDDPTKANNMVLENGCSASSNNKAYVMYQAVSNGGSLGSFGSYGSNYNSDIFAGFAKIAGYLNGLILKTYGAGTIIKMMIHDTVLGKMSEQGMSLGTVDLGANVFKVHADSNSLNACTIENSAGGSTALVLKTTSQAMGGGPAHGTGIWIYDENDNLLFRVEGNGHIHMPSMPTYADNATAKGDGLADGILYKTATGEVRITYT